MVYRVSITEYAEQCLDECLDYLMCYVGGTGNPQAVKNFVEDYAKVLDCLAVSAHSYGLCEDEALATLGERKIHFKHLSYKVFYHIKDSSVIIDLICHDSRDYKKLF